MFHLDVDAEQSGPIFDGRAAAAARRMATDAEHELAETGVNMVRAQLDRVLRNPTGYYESQIRTDRAAGDSVTTDGGVVYGPWLEGVSERNRTTTFEGYHTFRVVTQRVEQRALRVAERAVPRFLRVMR